MLIIGFGNKARQGKDTAAEAIREHYQRFNEMARLHQISRDVNVHIIKFADALYQEVNEALKEGIWKRREVPEVIPNDEFFLSWPVRITKLPDWVQPDPDPIVTDLAPYGKHPKLLQWWGTDFRRAQNPNYWVDKTFTNIPKTVDILLITDVRFPNEAYAVKNRGGYTINVQRLREDGQPYIASDRPADHISETALDGYNWDYYIKSKNAVVTQELAITYAELLRGLHK